MRIHGWLADNAGCGWYRIKLPFDQLAIRGHSVTYSEILPNETLDVLVGQRVCNPGPTLTWQRLAREGNTFLVFEIDDDLFHIDPVNTVAYNFFSRPGIRENLINNIKVAHLVTASTANLAEVVKQYNPNVITLPNCIPESLLDYPFPEPGHPILGWTGSATHAGDMEVMGKQLRRLLTQHPDIEVHLRGADFRQQLGVQFNSVTRVGRAGKWTDEDKRVTFSPWVPIEDHYNHLDFTVGFIPLAHNTFNHSKSHIKALELMARGVPVVASNEPSYHRLIEHEITGILIDREHEWFRCLRELAYDQWMRDELRSKARQIAAHYTIEDHAIAWEKAYAQK